MAGEWIAATKSLPKKREVVALSTKTGRSRHEVVGLLIEFWIWLDDETNDGAVSGVNLDSLIGIVGGDEMFWLAMAGVGWVTFLEGGIVIPNFGRWMGNTAKKRLKQNRNQAMWRKSAGAKGGGRRRIRDKEKFVKGVDRSVDGGVDGRVDRSQSTNLSTREEKRREENKRINTLPTQSADGQTTDSNKPRKTREPDTLFDAVVKVTGFDPDVTGAQIGRACKALRSADPPYTASEVLSLPAAIAARGLSFTLTPPAVEKYIGWTRSKPHEKPAPGGGLSRLDAQPGKYAGIGKRPDPGEAPKEQNGEARVAVRPQDTLSNRPGCP
jgi:hypothetical protein